MTNLQPVRAKFPNKTVNLPDGRVVTRNGAQVIDIDTIAVDALIDDGHLEIAPGVYQPVGPDPAPASSPSSVLTHLLEDPDGNILIDTILRVGDPTFGYAEDFINVDQNKIEFGQTAVDDVIVTVGLLTDAGTRYQQLAEGTQLFGDGTGEPTLKLIADPGNDAFVLAGGDLWFGADYDSANYGIAANGQAAFLSIAVDGLVSFDTYLHGQEIADPGAPPANAGRLYFKDVGGKTALMVRFPTGAPQQMFIEA